MWFARLATHKSREERMIMHRFRLFLLVFVASLSPVAAHAQVLYGSLVGNVTDPHKGAVPNAAIRVTDVLTGITP
jgi:hypothetical protein